MTEDNDAIVKGLDSPAFFMRWPLASSPEAEPAPGQPVGECSHLIMTMRFALCVAEAGPWPTRPWAPAVGSRQLPVFGVPGHPVVGSQLTVKALASGGHRTRGALPRTAARPMISYAQNLEDVVLDRALRASAGFYVDVGAASPSTASVTRHFYELGWSGIASSRYPNMFLSCGSSGPGM